jgi:hypothetical protein
VKRLGARAVREYGASLLVKGEKIPFLYQDLESNAARRLFFNKVHRVKVKQGFPGKQTLF